MARYPDAASPYFIEACNGLHEVHHDHFGLLDTLDCLAEAQNYISDREDEDEARAAQDARELADELAGLELTETICSEIIARKKAA